MKNETKSTKRVRGAYSSPRQEARQRRILEVARHEIGAVGYDAITMQKLAEAAEVSVKTLYNLYGSKDELLLAAVRDLIDTLQLEVDALGAKQGVEELILISEIAAQRVVKEPRYSEVLARTLFQAEPDHRLTRALLGGTRQHALRAFSISQGNGDIDAKADIEELADVFASHQWGLVLSWSKGLISGDRFPLAALRSQITTVLPVCKGDLSEWLVRKARGNGIPIVK